RQLHGRLAQRESAAFTRQRSLVRNQYRPQGSVYRSAAPRWWFDRRHHRYRLDVPHDLLIKGGTVVDGTGAPPRTADVAVDGGLISEVGKVDGDAKRVIDADGLLVTPGFVDIHTHYDGQVTWEDRLVPSSWHGVTTIVMGNCGVGFA